MTTTQTAKSPAPRKPRKPTAVSKPELGLTASWWKLISGEWPDRELIDHLEDFGKREAELEGLNSDLEALPPWLEIRQAAADHAAGQAELFAQADDFLAELADDAVM